MKLYIHLTSLLVLSLLLGCGTENEPTYKLNVNVSSNEGGTVTPTEGVFNKDEEVIITATPSNGWVFVGWEGDWLGTSNPSTLRMSRDYNIIGVFERRKYPLTLTIEGEGTVSERVVTSKTTEYPFQTVVELTPTPSLGSTFKEWGGDLSGNEVPKRITVDGIKNVIVRFEGPYSLHPNGVTILCSNSRVGQKGVVGGITYETVDRELLMRRRDEGSDLSRVCTSLITDMSSLFSYSQFNQPIENWDVSKVTTMNGMFYESKFNQPIGNWDVSKVTDMWGMFYNSPFNQSIGNWNVSSVRDMSFMFQKTIFNQLIGNWDVGKVTNMMGMFYESKFNQPIGDWNVGLVTEMNEMFRLSEFNRPIGNWNVSSVKNMNSMFKDSKFNQPIVDWNVSSVTNMSSMFQGDRFIVPFNQPIGNWDVSKVNDMSWMFHQSYFNQVLNKWCVSQFRFEPTQFSWYLSNDNKPVWGTCPTN